jgi:hypothetical protein
VTTALYEQENSTTGELPLDSADEAVVSVGYLNVEDDEIWTRICQLRQEFAPRGSLAHYFKIVFALQDRSDRFAEEGMIFCQKYREFSLFHKHSQMRKSSSSKLLDSS